MVRHRKKVGFAPTAKKTDQGFRKQVVNRPVLGVALYGLRILSFFLYLFLNGTVVSLCIFHNKEDELCLAMLRRRLGQLIDLVSLFFSLFLHSGPVTELPDCGPQVEDP